jgi:hypothetical protein
MLKRKGLAMKNDGEKAAYWPEGHWTAAKCVCVVIAIAAVILADSRVLTNRTALIATVIGIIYVLVVTWHYTRGNKKKK